MQIGNDTEFTTGPLVVHSEGPDENSRPDTKGWPFHVCRPSPEPGTSDYHTAVGIQSLADARLYAAAPDLLAALEYLAAQIDLSKLKVKKDFSLMNAHVGALKAIAKAKA